MTAKATLAVRLDPDFAELLRLFLSESEEGLSAMEQALLSLEAHPDSPEALGILFRVAHTLKGNAAGLSLAELAAFTHVLEDVLERLRSRELQAGSDVIGMLLASVDALREMVPAAVRNEALNPVHNDLLVRLRALAAAPSVGLEPVSVAPEGRAAETADTARREARSRTLRVDIETLDRILDLTGEITVARGRLRQLLESGTVAATGMALEAEREADRLHSDLQELVMRVRMVPMAPLFARYARTVRDAAAAEGKLALLITGGEDVEVDTKVVEAIRDPLTHLVRNALAHGLESPAVREQAGKPACGKIWLEAVRETSSIVIRIADDGAGLDRERILAAARRLGLVSGEAVSLGDAEVHRLIFEPGFSTSASVTGLSGRGVGLDVVRRNVESLRGSVGVGPREGGGTQFTIRLPLTLAIIQGFGVAVGDETLVAPLETVVECLDLPQETDVERATGVLNLRGEAVPFLRLRRTLGIAGRPGAREQVLVVQQQGHRVGLVADRLLGESQNVIKPLGPLFRDLPGIAASTILGDGRVALLLDVAAIAEEAVSGQAESALVSA